MRNNLVYVTKSAWLSSLIICLKSYLLETWLNTALMSINKLSTSFFSISFSYFVYTKTAIISMAGLFFELSFALGII